MKQILNFVYQQEKCELSICGTRNVYEVAPGPCKSTLTFVGTFNANGSIAAPAIIYSDLRMPSDIAEQIPEELYIGHSESGCKKSANFYEYIAAIPSLDG